MSAHLTTESHWALTYEVRDRHGQIIHDAFTVQVKAKSKMDAMLAAVDEVLDKTGAVNATCRSCRRL